MDQMQLGQSWTYRVAEGFEQSRLIVGATLEVDDKTSVVCCSVTKAPVAVNGVRGQTFTIPFLPIVTQAFWATALTRDGEAKLPPTFPRHFRRWKDNPRGLMAFTVPFDGFLDQMFELQTVRTKGSRGVAKTNRAAVIREIADMLASGLVTETEPFPKNEQEFGEILTRLKALDPKDITNKLVIGGFTDYPYGPDKQRCLECIYYLPHSLYCDLPELAVPVEPYWWCRLWRI